MRTLGEKIKDSYVVEKILRVVTLRYLHVVTTLEQFTDPRTMSVEEVFGQLKAFEERVKVYGGGGEENLLLTRVEWKAKEAKTSGESSTNSAKGRGNGGDRGRGRGCGQWRDRGHREGEHGNSSNNN